MTVLDNQTSVRPANDETFGKFRFQESPVLLQPFISWVLFIPCVYLLYRFVKGPDGMRKSDRIPPGPTGLPVLGYSPFIGTKPHEKFQFLGSKYGPIFALKLGSRYTVILNDYEAVKAAFTDCGEAFLDRYPGFAHQRLNGTDLDGKLHGLTMTSGPHWRSARRFALTTLRDLGMGKSVMQERILQEIGFFMRSLSEEDYRPKNLYHLTVTCTANIVFGMTFGKRFHHDDPSFKIILNFILNALPTLSNLGPVQIFPWLRLIPGKYRAAWEDFDKAKEELRKTLRAQLDLHQLDDVAGDYVSSFRRRQNEDALQKEDESLFDDYELLIQLQNLFGAGSETTASTIVWAFYFLLKHPHIQRTIQSEIDKNVANSEWITNHQKTELQYTSAFIKEVQRMANVVPLSIARKTTEDVDLLGYRIPKGSYVIPNLWNVHRDSKYWDEPEEFRPERFINHAGRVFEPPGYIPYSLGKRDCLGKALANSEIFLFVTNILRNFDLTIPDGSSLPPPEHNGGLTARPPSFSIHFQIRSAGMK